MLLSKELSASSDGRRLFHVVDPRCESIDARPKIQRVLPAIDDSIYSLLRGSSVATHDHCRKDEELSSRSIIILLSRRDSEGF